ncbi:tetratricopeptide repeat protein [Erythrobacter sp.]|uniref:tetratricopeptide repeat protein n=1 Tax=Erythrobacter sp. TaxID=1042 RepID=UPI002ED3AD5A
MANDSMTSGQALRWIALLLLALIAVMGVQRMLTGQDGSAARAAPAAPAWGPATYADELEAMDRVVARGRARLGANMDSWAAHDALASALHLRGQLTGRHEDLAAALESADRARTLAPEAGGPILSRSLIAMSLHRGDIAADEVPRIDGFAVPASAPELSEAEAIRGDVALYGGDYTRAFARYEAAEDLAASLGTKVRMADWHRHHGRFDKARAILLEGLETHKPSPWIEASIQLQLGAIELQRGDWEGAQAHFAKADRTFPGWWLARAHLGQMAATRGEFAAAERFYLEAMEGTKRPSVMDALVAVYEAQGRTEDARALSERAGGLWKARVASHPAAYADHAFEAYLSDGDSAMAWQLARVNYQARPYGDGRIGLARAAAERGRDASARAILEELEATGWRSTEQYRVLAEVCERLGDENCATGAKANALEISPLAFDDRNDFLFFSHH